MAPARRRAVARETLDIYAPIAGRLGLYNLKLELEDLGFKAAYPHRYRVLERALKKARGNQKQFLTKIADTMRVALVKADLKADVSHARETSLQHLQQDAAQGRAAVGDRRRVRPARRGRQGGHLLSRAGRGARGVQAHAGPLQGLHRDPARQRLPVAAHHAVRPERHSDRSADPHRGHAPRGRGRHRRALEIQGQREPRATRTSARASGSRTWSTCRKAAAPRTSSRASRSTCSPTRSTCSRPRARSCACRAAPPWWTSPTPCTPTSAIAAWRPR